MILCQSSVCPNDKDLNDGFREAFRKLQTFDVQILLLEKFTHQASIIFVNMKAKYVKKQSWVIKSAQL